VSQHVRLTSVAGVLRLLVGETSQSPVVLAVGAVRVAAVALRQFLRGKAADFGGKRPIRKLDPRLVVARAGFYARGGGETFLLHTLDLLRLEVVHQH
jgi:hypothetical protein